MRTGKQFIWYLRNNWKDKHDEIWLITQSVSKRKRKSQMIGGCDHGVAVNTPEVTSPSLEAGGEVQTP